MINASLLHAEESLRFSIDNKNSPAIPPYSWYNYCTDEFQGFNKELYQRLAGDLALSLELIEAEVADQASDMVRGSLSLIRSLESDLALTHPGFVKNNADFYRGNETVLHIDQVLLLPINHPDIGDISQLKNMTGAGMVPEEILMKFKLKGIDLSVLKSSAIEESANNIASGVADYWIASKFIAQYLINGLELHNKIKFSELKIGTSTNFYMVTANTEKNVLLMAKVDKLIASYYKTGYIDFLKSSVMHSWLANRSCLIKPKAQEVIKK